jgi:hypothetical protein
VSRHRDDEPVEVEVQRPAARAEDRQAAGAAEAVEAVEHRGRDAAGDGWLRPEPGARVRQTVASGPFVVQHREDLGLGGCRLVGHGDARATTFVVLGYSQRSEVGLPCHVVHLRDERDGREYVVDTALCGPGLPADAFVLTGLTFDASP